jgi:large conductance mechanosensitive channel
MLKLLGGFRDFIMRGNVIDLAVGIVIGAAFTGLVTNFTSSFIEPLLKVFSGGGQLGGSFTIRSVMFPWSQFVNAIIAFLITSSVLYFLVITPMNMINERRKRGTEQETKLPSDEVKLLMEIRDALVAANGVPPRPVADEPAAKATPAPVAQRKRSPGGPIRR